MPTLSGMMPIMAMNNNRGDAVSAEEISHPTTLTVVTTVIPSQNRR